MATTHPTEAWAPQAQARELQSTLQPNTDPVLDEVSAFVVHSSHHDIAKTSQVTAKDTTAGDMPDMQNLSQHHFPLLKLPTELRFEIFRLAFQDFLAVFTFPANTSFGTELTRGALALLDTCQALRVESVAVMEPLANASQSSLQSLRRLVESSMVALDVQSMGVNAFQYAFLHLVIHWHLLLGISRVDKICCVLADARGSDKKMGAG